MEGAAIVLCEGLFRSINGKTAHGLVRGSDRFRIVGLVDPPTARLDAGEVLDGRRRGIPISATIGEAIARSVEPPRFSVVGVATSGGRFTPELRASLAESLERGLSIVNGLHEYASDDLDLVEKAARTGAKILDIRRPKPPKDLRFWTGEVLAVRAPRIAILGTDCALGKRTTTRLLARACGEAGIRAEWIFTGQTGWMEGAPHGILLDSLPNDFVCGELEGAILSCASDLSPDVILIEGQSSLRNPSGPCGSELIVAAGSRGVVLQHAPGRRYFEGLQELGCVVPPLGQEIELIRLLGARTLAVTLNGEGLAREDLDAARARLERDLGIPVALPLEEGVECLVPAIRDHIARETAG